MQHKEMHCSCKPAAHLEHRRLERPAGFPGGGQDALARGRDRTALAVRRRVGQRNHRVDRHAHLDRERGVHQDLHPEHVLAHSCSRDSP